MSVKFTNATGASLVKSLFALLCLGLITANTAATDQPTDRHHAPANKIGAYTNEAYGKSPAVKMLADPTAYFFDRSKAIEVAFDRKWAVAQPLLEELVSQYPDDGDTWYLLGLSSMQTGTWAKAIHAFEKTLALGTALKGVPSGSSPSNDIMINIAQAYAALGDAANSKKWAEKALEARYDDRPSLGGKPHFEATLSTDVYRKLIGTHIEEGLSRNDLWRSDLRILDDELRRLHVNLYHKISAENFEQKIADIELRIPTLSDQEIVFAFMELVGGLGNGHNLLIPTNGAKGSFSRLPVEFYWFSDGLFIVDASEAYQGLIGSEVTMIGGVLAKDVLDKSMVLNARDNEMQHRWLAPYYVSLPEVLKGIGVVEDAKSIKLSIVHADGKNEELKLTGEKWSFEGFPKLPKLKNTKQPRYLEKSEQLFWMEALPDYNTILVQFNWVAESKEKSLAAFSQDLIDEAQKTGADNLILDLRHNPGGNGSILPSLVRALIYFEASHPEKKLFVIAGRGTYSAAHSLLTTLDGLSNAVIVGEPSGTRPNAIGEAGWFKLPHSGLMGLASSQFHQVSSAEDHRIWIAPHIPTHQSSVDYFSGQDPALQAIFNVIRK
jgi:hypothetical protein